jgi:uncharacterized iron-regulated membrane protein
MKVRITVLLLALALCAVGLLWLHTQVMPHQAWAVQGEHWEIAAVGWHTLLYAWPVGLAGLIAGGLVGLVAGGWWGQQATKRDLAEQHQAAQQAQAVARAVEEAARQMQAHAAEARDEATRAAAQADQRQAFVEARIRAVDARQAEIGAQARATIAEAEKRRINAAGAAERRRRKLERLKPRNSSGAS